MKQQSVEFTRYTHHLLRPLTSAGPGVDTGTGHAAVVGVAREVDVELGLLSFGRLAAAGVHGRQSEQRASQCVLCRTTTIWYYQIICIQSQNMSVLAKISCQSKR